MGTESQNSHYYVQSNSIMLNPYFHQYHQQHHQNSSLHGGTNESWGSSAASSSDTSSSSSLYSLESGHDQQRQHQQQPTRLQNAPHFNAYPESSQKITWNFSEHPQKGQGFGEHGYLFHGQYPSGNLTPTTPQPENLSSSEPLAGAKGSASQIIGGNNVQFHHRQLQIISGS